MRIIRLSNDEHHALKSAVVLGALASRQAALRTLVASNNGYQAADAYEAELAALQRAGHAVVDAKPGGAA